MNEEIEVASSVKNFLELVQPNPVKYGYPLGVKREKSFVTYQLMNTVPTFGIGNRIISEKQTYIVTVQTKTALQNMIYSDLIRHGTHKKNIQFVSDSLRKDTTVEVGWINTIILSVYVGLDIETYTAEEVRAMLQEIADMYIFVTNRYAKNISESFIDHYTVPPLEDKDYNKSEVIRLKQEYLDKLILNTTEF